MNRTVLYVAAVAPNKIGGVESFCRELAIQLKQNGWSLVFCGNSQPSREVLEFLTLPGLTVDVLHYQPGLGLRQVVEMTSVLLRHRPSVLIYHLGGILRTYPLLAKTFGVRKVIYQDGTSRMGKPKAFPIAKHLIASFLVRPIDMVIAATRYVEDAIRSEALVPQNRVRVIHNGVDVCVAASGSEKRRIWREHFQISLDEHVVLQVGWIVPQKGFDKLLQAAKLVLMAEPRTRFVLAGAGEYQEEYARLATDLGIASRIVWTGAIESPLRDGIYALADVYCQLSQWQEAGAFTLAEAMSYGLPIIATRVGGIPDLVRDGENGFLVEPNDIEGVARKTLLLLNDSELCIRMGQAGRKIACAEFNVTTTAQHVLSSLGICYTRIS